MFGEGVGDLPALFITLMPVGIALLAFIWITAVSVPPFLGSLRALNRSLYFWFNSSSSSSDANETASLLPNNTSSSPSDPLLHDAGFEVVNHEEISLIKGPSFLLRGPAAILAIAVSALWIKAVVVPSDSVIVVPPVPEDSPMLKLTVIILSVAHSVIAGITTLVACMDGKRAGLRSPVDIEKLKRFQSRVLAGSIVYYIALFVLRSDRFEPFVAFPLAGLVLFLVAINASIRLGRLQRKRVDGLIPSPELDASLLSRLTVSWLNPLMEQGHKSKLETSDVWDAAVDELSSKPLNDYRRYQADYRLRHGASAKRPGILYSLLMLHWKTLAAQIALVTVDTLLYFTGALFINRILDATPEIGTPGPLAYVYVILMFVFSITRYLVYSAEQQLVLKVGIRIRNLLSALIYEKSLTRAPTPQKNESDPDAKEEKDASASVGKIVNLMSVDATTIGDWIGYIYTPVMTGLQILLCVGSLIFLLGWSALPGVTVLIILLFSGGPLANTINKIYAEWKGAIDRRVTAFNEVVQGVKIIKFFAWERKFYDKIDVLREKEFSHRWRLHVFEALNRVLWYSAPFVTTLCTLGSYTVLMGKDLTAPVAFTALALFNLLREPLERFPDTIVQLLDSLVSLARIEAFLDESDLDTQAVPSAFLGFSGNASFSFAKPEEDGAKPSTTPAAVVRNWRNVWGLWKKKETKTVEESEPLVVEGNGLRTFALRDLNVTFADDKLSVIVGATGSGKTTLLLSLLGETHLLSGTLHRPPTTTLSYVPQQAWLLNASIRDNILFSEPLDRSRYLRVIKACALERDLELLEGGDLTEVGEKGINLSGGQKQRIALARAAYSRAKVVVLDDPLSAVDAPTAKHLMEECILGLLADRTRILVTNAAGLAIPRCDDIYIMQSGRITLQGPVDRVLADLSSTLPAVLPLDDTASTSASSYTAFNASSASTLGGSSTTSAFTDGLREMTDVLINERKKYLSEDPTRFQTLNASIPLPTSGEVPNGVLVADEVGKKLVEEESMADGVVSTEVYTNYVQAAGGIAFVLVLLAGYSINHISTMSLDGLVYLWCKAYETTSIFMYRVAMTTSSVLPFTAPFTAPLTTTTQTLDRNSDIALRFIPTYFVLMIVCLAIIVGRLLLLMYGSMQAGRNIHRRMMGRLLASPVRFFEVTPVGRIVNRFTKDMQSVDRAVGSSCGNLTYNVVLIGFIVFYISTIVPFLLIAIVPMAYIYNKVGQLFVRASTGLKRLDSVARSPVFSHFSETLTGVIVIRAFNDNTRFSSEARSRIDKYSRVNFLFMLTYQWLNVRVQFISSFILLVIGVLILSSGVGRDLAGLCFNFAMSLTSLLANLVFTKGWLDSNMNSMERCNEYLKLEQEAPAIVENNRPPTLWPHQGRISIKDLKLRYAPDLPEVLKGMNAEIGALEKVGIVGRTGAGKSSLALALFRMVEPSGGTIVIDDVDIMRIGLEDLRSRLTIIPQDPVLFTGTIRSNLDPFESIPDADLWVALKRAHLISSIPTDSPKASPKAAAADLKRASVSAETLMDEDPMKEEETDDVSITLDTSVSEGGSNLSAGQKQLLCLARALARRSRVIVMDEATASVDPETDSRIQVTIREEFDDCTVITIAHRLRSIVDYDRVLVLDAGQVIENGTPYDLIQNSSVGVFRNMCQETGEFDELVSIARTRHILGQNRSL